MGGGKDPESDVRAALVAALAEGNQSANAEKGSESGAASPAPEQAAKRDPRAVTAVSWEESARQAQPSTVGQHDSADVARAARVAEARQISKETRSAREAQAQLLVAHQEKPAAEIGTKSCPFCAETIKVAAVKCKHCQSTLAPAPTPQTISDPTPTQNPPPKDPHARPSGSRTLAFIAICAVLAVVTAVSERNGTSDKSSTSGPKCDGGEQARRKWIETPNGGIDEGGTPYDGGYRVEGACNERLRTRMIDCTTLPQFMNRDDPVSVEAHRLGFTVVVCEAMKNGDWVATETAFSNLMR